jgi:cob(I)alamin adenosyltransferase
MKIYTKSGDLGETSLFGGKRVKKHHMSIQAYGTVDELNSWCGLVKDHLKDSNQKEQLLSIQDTLFVIGSHLASNGDEKLISKLPTVTESSISALENSIDEMDKDLAPMKNFILPGGHFLSSYCHLSRCVCRRVERLIIELSESLPVNPIIVKYLNRLSDYFFTLSRHVLLQNNIQEQPWIPSKK